LRDPLRGVSSERTVPDSVERSSPPTAPVDPPAPSPPRRPIARLPPLEEMLARASVPVGLADANDAPSVVAEQKPPRKSLARLPPLSDVEGHASAPDANAMEVIEEIELRAEPISPPPPPPPQPRALARLGGVASSPPASAPPAPTPTLTDATTPEDVAPPADAPPPEELPRSMLADVLPPLAAVERTSVPMIVEGNASDYCRTCARLVPRAEIQMLTRDGRKAFAVCPVCNGYLGRSGAASPRADPAPNVSGAARVREAPRPDAARRSSAIAWDLVEALGWPFAWRALPTLLVVTCIVWLLTSASALGIAPLAVAGRAIAIGVLATCAAVVIHATHRGEGGDRSVGAVLRHLCVLLVGGLPLLAALASGALGVRSPTVQTMLVVGGIVVFCVYVPAGQIVVASRESFGAALSPIAPIRFALAVGRAYLIPCAILFAIAIAHLVVVGVTMMMGVAIFGSSPLGSPTLEWPTSGWIMLAWPTLGWGVLVSLLVSAGVLVEARLLGVVVREDPFDVAVP